MTWKWLIPFWCVVFARQGYQLGLANACMILRKITHLMLFQRVVQQIQKDYIVDG